MNNNDYKYIAIAFFWLWLATAGWLFIAEADNHYLEQHYYQCTGKYV